MVPTNHNTQRFKEIIYIKKEKKNQIWTLGTLPMCDSMQSTHKVDQVSQRDTNCGYTTESFLAYRNQTLLLGLY